MIDRLGFLQFEQLWAAVLELEGGIGAGAWSGEADRCRSVLSGASPGPPLTTVMERILRMLDDRHWLIWTSRPTPLRAGLSRLHRERGAERFPAPGEVLVDAGELDPSEKTLILFRHAKAADLPAGTRAEIRARGAEIVAHRHFTPERIRRFIAGAKALPPGPLGLARILGSELTNGTEAMATSFAALSTEHRDLLVSMLDTPPGPVTERDLTNSLRRHHDGPLPRRPAELVDRLTDHFLRVLA